MDNLILTHQSSKLELYRNLVLKKEQLKKEAFALNNQYLATFGSELIQLYDLKIKCIKLKKMIAYCQSKHVASQAITQKELDIYIQDLSQKYDKHLTQMINEIKFAKEGTPISFEEAHEVKVLYRKLAKKLHPDLNPNYDEALWEQLQTTYLCNDLAALKEIELMLKDDTTVAVVDEKRIVELQEEIETIKTTKPYTYSELLNNPQACLDKHEQFQKETKQYEDYKQSLETIFQSFKIQTILN